jgi:hypothetical protein
MKTETNRKTVVTVIEMKEDARVADRKRDGPCSKRNVAGKQAAAPQLVDVISSHDRGASPRDHDS